MLWIKPGPAEVESRTVVESEVAAVPPVTLVVATVPGPLMIVAVSDSCGIAVPLPSLYETWMVAAEVDCVSFAAAAVAALLTTASTATAVEVSPAAMNTDDFAAL